MSNTEINHWDAIKLNAYLDGELDAQAAAQIEVEMASDPSIREFVEQRRGINRLTSELCNKISRKPLTPGLISLLERAESQDSGHDNWYNDRRWLSLAAGFAILGIGFSAGYFTGETKTENYFLTQQVQRQAAEQDLQKAYNRVLENTPSGETISWVNEAISTKIEYVPIRTLQTEDNRYCREFREILITDAGKEARHGISCREGKSQWKTKVLFPIDDHDVL